MKKAAAEINLAVEISAARKCRGVKAIRRRNAKKMCGIGVWRRVAAAICRGIENNEESSMKENEICQLICLSINMTSAASSSALA
jgi:hypothetical protein